MVPLMNPIVRRRTTVLFVFFLAFAPAAVAASRIAERSRNGMVVSAHPLASRAGVEVLQKGGNAVDAAVATGFALAVVYPAAGNIGGGGFLIAVMKNGRTAAFDFRETAPLRAHPRMFLDSSGAYDGTGNHEGHLSVGVPGTVAGFFAAHEALGRLPMSSLLAPSIRLAEKGFPVSWPLHDDFVALDTLFALHPGTAQAFRKRGKEPYRPGDVWKQPDLARTLKRIRRDGRDGFYRGETARLLAEEMRRNGGLITMEDLAAYRAVERQPVRGSYRGYDVLSMAPPSSGGVTLIEMLNILEGYDLALEGYHSAGHLHLLAEAMRRGYADRATHLGDPDFNPDAPVTRLLSKEYAATLRSSIDPRRASRSRPDGPGPGTGNTETTHYAVVDAEGNAVVVTTTLEDWYGSKIVAPGTGFLLNNEMGDFNPVPGRTDSTGLVGTPPNLVAPGKRMLSSMTPTILLHDGKPWLLVGSPGGRTIINTVLQVIVDMVDFGMDLGEAVAAPRIHHQWLPDLLRVEKFGASPETVARLREMGHRVVIRVSSREQGRAMGIVIDPATGVRHGAADPRQPEGSAAGY
jgi:gamma-glutamyltranspeptidase/glutathione hydrolase